MKNVSVRIGAILLLIESFLLLIPLIILGNSINWPASLSEPAEVNFPLIIDQYPSMMTGYFFYLIYSILFWPVAYFTGKTMSLNKSNSGLIQVAHGFALLSVFARCLGIVRWLFTMPILADLYLENQGNTASEETLEITYQMLNSYAGGIGESLGVSLFTVIWLILISIFILNHPERPNWLSYFSMTTAILLAINLLEVINIDTKSMPTISVVCLQFWMFATSIYLFTKR